MRLKSVKWLPQRCFQHSHVAGQYGQVCIRSTSVCYFVRNVALMQTLRKQENMFPGALWWHDVSSDFWSAPLCVSWSFWTPIQYLLLPLTKSCKSPLLQDWVKIPRLVAKNENLKNFWNDTHLNLVWFFPSASTGEISPPPSQRSTLDKIPFNISWALSIQAL